MTYTVAQITTPDGVYFTARKDDRTPQEVVEHGIRGYDAGQRSPIYESLNQYRQCFVKNIFTGLTEAEAEIKKKTIVEYVRTTGTNVLNVRE